MAFEVALCGILHILRCQVSQSNCRCFRLTRTYRADTFFLIAVVLSSWYGGFRAGIVATVLGAFLSEYFFLRPLYSIAWSLQSIGRLSYFSGVAILICFLNSRLRAAQHRAEIHAIEA
jgi:K+-sensing histidine kinase KdpD